MSTEYFIFNYIKRKLTINVKKSLIGSRSSLNNMLCGIFKIIYKKQIIQYKEEKLKQWQNSQQLRYAYFYVRILT